MRGAAPRGAVSTYNFPPGGEVAERVRSTEKSRPSLSARGFAALTVHAQVQCCFTSTETIRPVKDGEPRMATSTFTQLLGSYYYACQVERLSVFTINSSVPPQQ